MMWDITWGLLIKDFLVGLIAFIILSVAGLIYFSYLVITDWLYKKRQKNGRK